VNKAAKPADPTAPAGAHELRRLLERAQSGDASTLPVLRRMMQEPGFADVCGGDLASQAELSLTAAVAGDNLAFREGLRAKMVSLRAELAGPDPRPVERLLVERVVISWLQAYEADIRYAQSKDHTLAWGDYHQRRIDRSHRRLLQAIRTLEVVRRLAAPVLRAEVGRPPVRLAANAPVEGTRG
jgi:hypothetical protein